MCSMRISRRLSLPGHAAIELAVGLAMMLAPAAIGLGIAGLVVSFALGTILTGAALSVASSSRGLAVAWHNEFDRLFALATALAAVALALGGQNRAAAFLVSMVA